MGFRIVGIGEVLWDLLLTGPQLGGAPANFSYHARALGAEGHVITRVGSDDQGREILRRFRDMGGLESEACEKDFDNWAAASTSSRTPRVRASWRSYRWHLLLPIHLWRSVRSVQWTEMAISLELHNTGDADIGAEIQALVEHALSDRPGDGACRSSVLARTTVGR